MNTFIRIETLGVRRGLKNETFKGCEKTLPSDDLLRTTLEVSILWIGKMTPFDGASVGVFRFATSAYL
jgi:hypothetical protein